MEDILDVAIIGGGVTGLAAAYFLESSTQKTTYSVFESSGRLGGNIHTQVRDGFLMEDGPDSFITDKPHALELSKNLGLDDELIGTSKKFRASFVVSQRQLCELPVGFHMIAPSRITPFLFSSLITFSGKLRAFQDVLIPPSNSNEDESVASFICRRLGSEIFNTIGQPMVGGVYSGDATKLSANCVLPRFKALEKKHGSLILGLLKSRKRIERQGAGRDSGPRYSMFMTFKNGMQSLVGKLEKSIPQKNISLNASVQQVSWDVQQKCWHILVSNKGSIQARNIVMTTSAGIAAHLIRSQSPDLSVELEKIPYESITIINMGFKKSQIKHPLNGFGFVVPIKEGLSMIATSFSSVKFEGRAPEDHVLLRVFVGGAFGKRFYEMEPAKLVRVVIEELTDLLGIEGRPVIVSRRSHENAMPQYHVGHKDLLWRIRNLADELPGLHLIGSAYDGVGIPDCIRQAEETAQIINRV